MPLPPVSEKHACAIGRVAINWALVEGILAKIVIDLLSLNPEPGHASTAEVSIIQRIQLIKTLIGLTGNKSWINEWGALENELGDMRVMRNDVIHAEWRGSPDPLAPNQGIRTKAKGRVTITLNFAPTTEMVKLASEIRDLEEKLGRFAYTVVIGGAPAIISGPNPPGPPPIRLQGRKGSAQVPLHPPKRERKRQRKLLVAKRLP
jgi:hypothetical protein